MIDYTPADYHCPLCHLAQGGETIYNAREDIVDEDAEVMAFVSPKWWPNNPRTLIVIPRSHFDNIYSNTDTLLSQIVVVSKQLAVAMKTVYRSVGTSLRRQNEPGGDQDVFHFHLHGFPYYFADDLYLNTDVHRFVTAAERQGCARKLNAFLARIALPAPRAQDCPRNRSDP